MAPRIIRGAVLRVAASVVMLVTAFAVLASSFSGLPATPHGLAPATETRASPASLSLATPVGLASTPNDGPAPLASGTLAAKQMHLEPATPPLPLLGNLTPDAPTSGTVSQFVLSKGGPAANFYLDVPFAKRFQVQNLSAILYLDSATGTSVFLNVSLTVYDWNGVSLVQVASQEWRVQTNNVIDFQRFTFAFAPVNYTFAQGDQVRLRILDTSASDTGAILATDAINADSQLDVMTTTFVNIDRLFPAPGSVRSPKEPLVVQANVSDPFGSREIGAARLSVADPLGNPIFTYATMTALQSGTAWTFFQSSVPPPLTNGTYAISVVAIEKNGVTDTRNETVLVRAPAFVFQKTASISQAKSGTRFSYFLEYNNTGTGPAARVWINDTLPSQLSFQSSTPAPTSSVGQSYVWALTSVAPGSYVIQVNVQVKGGTSGVAYIRNWASLNDTDERGFPWPMLMSHADVVVNGPLLALALTSTPASWVHSNQSVVASIGLTNSGDAAQTIWVNLTIPAGLAYASDTSALLGGVPTSPAPGVEAFRFTNMPPGSPTPVTWTFTVTVAAAPDLVRGASLAITVGLNYSSTNGLWMPNQVQALPLVAASPFLQSAAVRFVAPTAVPNVPVPLSVNFTNAGNEPTGTVWINLTLDSLLSFVSASVPSSVANGVVTLTVVNAPPGADNVTLAVSIAPFTPDRRVLAISGALNYTDGYGNPLPGVRASTDTISVAEPSMSFLVSPANTTAEAGTRVVYSVTGVNAGSGTAGSVWLNLSLPSSLAYVSDSFGVSPVTVGPVMAWVWRNYLPGTRSYTLVFDVLPTAPDRSNADLLFRLQSSDVGGNLQNATAFGARVAILAPEIQVSVWADHNQSLPGATFTYTLRAQNVGSTVAHVVWLTDAVDSHLEVIYYTATVQATGTTTLNWTYQDVQPGQVLLISLFVKVVDSTSARTVIPNVLKATYTNSAGTVLRYVLSSPAATQVEPDLMPVAYILAGGSLIGALVVFLVYRRYRVQIEDVFLIYRDGILLTHLSRTILRDKDEDQLSGMLTAVQDFVKDAFTYGEHRELHQLEFGDYHVLIERGAYVYLAVVYEGRDSGMIRKRVRTVLDEVESTFGPVLAKWDGDMERVAGTRDLIREGLLVAKRPWSLVRAKSG